MLGFRKDDCFVFTSLCLLLFVSLWLQVGVVSDYDLLALDSISGVKIGGMLCWNI